MSKIKIITLGSSRAVIRLWGIVIKIPCIHGASGFGVWHAFLQGLQSNIQEKVWHDSGYAGLCPIKFYIPGGFLTIMPYCEKLDRDAWFNFDYDNFINHTDYILPVEEKMDSFGILDGKIVAVDYDNR